MFGYPKFDENGVKILSEIGGQNAEMQADISVIRLKSGQSVSYESDKNEIAILLTEGKVRLVADGVDYVAERTDVFGDAPTCLHVSRRKRIAVIAVKDAEYIFVSTENERDFGVTLYKKEDITYTVSSEGIWENVCVRDVNTVFDYSTAPYSNLVIGEVLARQGRWWSYIPHGHPQPELYYYKYAKKEAFGACFIGETAYTVKDGSYGCFAGGVTHAQVTAPCYPEYCCWIIRHLPGNPWQKTRIVAPDYQWIEDDLNKINYKQFK
jgi:Uncharacterized enzyme involved in inositol metabolism